MGGMGGMGGMPGMGGMGGMGGMPGMGGMGGMGDMDFEKVRTSPPFFLELWSLFEWQMMADMKKSGYGDGDTELPTQESESDSDDAGPPPLESLTPETPE